MKEDIFKSIQEKKTKARDLIKKAASFGWIDDDKCQALLEKLDNDIITIGVIGQMKCGKSTFLNTFVFGQEILPAATTPMTAALSIITYGQEKKITAEFYTKEEWQEQLKQANRSLDEAAGNALQESSIKAAKELIEKSAVLGSEIDSLLGMTKDDSLEHLIDYVGADGKYIGITKAVTIYYPDEKLKGVEIVDTPGFNDPIVSREERTKSFLNKADAVLMMLYAGRPFDSTDREIIFKHVSQCGMGKILIAVNKYDIPYGNGEDETMIKQYVKDEIKKACQLSGNIIVNDFLRNVEPIAISSIMELIAQMYESSKQISEEMQFSYNRLSEIFHIHTPVEFHQHSHIQELSTAIMNLINKEKEQILFARPISAVLSAGQNKNIAIDNELYQQQTILRNINATDDEIEEKADDLSKSHRRIRKKINNLSEELDDIFRSLIGEGSKSLQRLIDDTFEDIKGKIDNLSESEDIKKDLKLMNQEIAKLRNREIPNFLEEFSRKTNMKIKRSLKEFFSEVDDVFERFLPDYDTKGLIDQIHSQTDSLIDVQNSIQVKDNVFDDKRSDKEKAITFGVSAILGFIEGYLTLGITNISGCLITGYEVSRIQAQLNASFDNIYSKIQPRQIMEKIKEQRNSLINIVEKSLIQEVLNPLAEQTNQIKDMKKNREQAIADANSKILTLQHDKLKLSKELSEIENLKNETLNGKD